LIARQDRLCVAAVLRNWFFYEVKGDGGGAGYWVVIMWVKDLSFNVITYSVDFVIAIS